MQNYIDQKLCKQCKLCIEVCPCNIIENGTEVNFIKEKMYITGAEEHSDNSLIWMTYTMMISYC